VLEQFNLAFCQSKEKIRQLQLSAIPSAAARNGIGWGERLAASVGWGQCLSQQVCDSSGCLFSGVLLDQSFLGCSNDG